MCTSKHIIQHCFYTHTSHSTSQHRTGVTGNTFLHVALLFCPMTFSASICCWGRYTPFQAPRRGGEAVLHECCSRLRLSPAPHATCYQFSFMCDTCCKAHECACARAHSVSEERGLMTVHSVGDRAGSGLFSSIGHAVRGPSAPRGVLVVCHCG